MAPQVPQLTLTLPPEPVGMVEQRMKNQGQSLHKIFLPWKIVISSVLQEFFI